MRRVAASAPSACPWRRPVRTLFQALRQAALACASLAALSGASAQTLTPLAHQPPDFVSVSAKEILGSARASQFGDGERLRILPTENGPDGFFAAVLRRKLG